MAAITDSTDRLAEKLKQNIDELKARCKVSDEAMTNMSLLYSLIWTEACYDPMNESTERFAKKLLPHIQALNAEFRFKR